MDVNHLDVVDFFTDHNDDMCLVDSRTTHTVLKGTKYFSYLVKQETDVSIIFDPSKIIEAFGRPNLLLSRNL